MTDQDFNTIQCNVISLRQHALYLTHQNTTDADDLLQETILRAITHYHQFQDTKNIKGWLYVIMKCAFINNFRRLRRQRGFLVHSEEEISSTDLLYSSTKNYSENIFIQEDVEKALKKLPSKYSTPFSMYLNGYRYQEIAEYLKIPLGTLKIRIYFSRKTMKKYLSDYLEK